MKKYLLPPNGNFYKANLHCHSTFSDGRLTPQQLKDAYRAQGYSIIAFTDHDVFIPHPELRDETFLPLNGFEVEINDERGPWGRSKTCHICFVALDESIERQPCWHRSKYTSEHQRQFLHLVKFDESAPDYEREYTHECIGDMMRRAREAGFFVTYNHPTWSLESYPDYIGFEGMHAMEIVNYGCIVEGWDDYNPRVYDDLLTAGKRIFCTATDDNHNVHPIDSPRGDSFGGFTMIKADALDYPSIARALEAGHFYASRGPEIHSLWYEDGRIHVTCSPAAKIQFNYQIRTANVAYAAPDRVICSASAEVPHDAVYVRVTVFDEKGRTANSNAYFVDELER